jgi:hypothetical protein
MSMERKKKCRRSEEGANKKSEREDYTYAPTLFNSNPASLYKMEVALPQCFSMYGVTDHYDHRE